MLDKLKRLWPFVSRREFDRLEADYCDALDLERRALAERNDALERLAEAACLGLQAVELGERAVGLGLKAQAERDAADELADLLAAQLETANARADELAVRLDIAGRQRDEWREVAVERDREANKLGARVGRLETFRRQVGDAFNRSTN